jgi:hypothetical protein
MKGENPPNPTFQGKFQFLALDFEISKHFSLFFSSTGEF